MTDMKKFSLTDYAQILDAAKQKFEFVFYDDYQNKSNFILWRHDVDCSPESALRLAKLEKTKGVKSTYFIWLHSSYYHFYEKENYDAFVEIASMGHDLGLHFDSRFYLNEIDMFEKNLLSEKIFLENFFEVRIKAFSFHNPTQKILSVYNKDICEMTNTYNSFLFSDVKYVSDSRGRKDSEQIINEIGASDCLKAQVLTHPVFWSNEQLDCEQKISRCVNNRAEKVLMVRRKALEQII